MSDLKRILDSFGKRVIQQARTRLTKDKINFTKEAYNGLQYDLKGNDTKFTITFSMPIHASVLDEGISGTKKKYNTRFKYKATSNLIGVEAKTGQFAKWAKFRGLRGRDNGYTKANGVKVKGTGRFITNKAFGFALAISQKKKGREGNKFFTKSFEQQFDKLPDEIANNLDLGLENI